jgi:hypothetical protein
MSIEVASNWKGSIYIRVCGGIVDTVQVSRVVLGHLKNYLRSGYHGNRYHSGTAKFLAVCETDSADYIEVVYVTEKSVCVFISEGVGFYRETISEIITTEEFLELLEQV